MTFSLNMNPRASLRPKYVLDARDIYIAACDMLSKVEITKHVLDACDIYIGTCDMLKKWISRCDCEWHIAIAMRDMLSKVDITVWAAYRNCLAPTLTPHLLLLLLSTHLLLYSSSPQYASSPLCSSFYLLCASVLLFSSLSTREIYQRIYDFTLNYISQIHTQGFQNNFSMGVNYCTLTQDWWPSS